MYNAVYIFDIPEEMWNRKGQKSTLENLFVVNLLKLFCYFVKMI